MKNTLPYINSELLTLAGVAANAAGTLGAAIPLLQNTKPNITADIQPVVDAILAHASGRTEMEVRRAALDEAVRNARILLTFGRDSLKPNFGGKFNNKWLALGYAGSLAITREVAQVLSLLRAYQEFLQNNATNEVPTKDFTALHVGVLLTQLETALNNVTEQEGVVTTLMTDRDAKVETLRKRVRGLINELSQKLDPLDPRWKQFGLNMPGAKETPEKVTGLVATLIGATAAAMKWTASARADYYRVWRKVVGVDAEPVAVGSPADLDFTMENLPTGSQIEIYVSAVNNGGESELSEKVTVTTHA